jgi:hypothetical protein
MQSIWAMDKEQIFHELMRVHAESAKLMCAAQLELERLQSLLDELDDDGDLRH